MEGRPVLSCRHWTWMSRPYLWTAPRGPFPACASTTRRPSCPKSMGSCTVESRQHVRTSRNRRAKSVSLMAHVLGLQPEVKLRSRHADARKPVGEPGAHGQHAPQGSAERVSGSCSYHVSPDVAMFDRNRYSVFHGNHGFKMAPSCSSSSVIWSS